MIICFTGRPNSVKLADHPFNKVMLINNKAFQWSHSTAWICYSIQSIKSYEFKYDLFKYDIFKEGLQKYKW